MGRMRRRRLLPLLLMAGPAAWLAACATGPRSVDISQQQLQSALERRFPYEVRPAGVFLLGVGVPRLTLLPQQDRLRLEFVLEMADRIVPGALRGSLALSFGLRYQAADATIRATEVRVERIELQGLPGELQDVLQMAGAMVAGSALQGLVLYTLRSEDLARAQGWTPGAIRVMPWGVRVDLLPPVARAGGPAAG
jgi:hypothetical protein